jgi:general secretion pathway protein G
MDGTIWSISRLVRRLWTRPFLHLTGFQPRQPAKSSPEAGFSLIEILVALAIIGMIMGLVAPRVVGYLSDSKTKTAQIQIQSLSAALDLYYLDIGRYPTADEGLTALIAKPSGTANWNGPYLKGGSVPNDPWGRPYAYRMPAEKEPFEITSGGSDGRGAMAQSGMSESVVK